MLTRSSIHFDWQDYTIPSDSVVPVSVLQAILREVLPEITEADLLTTIESLDRRWQDDRGCKLPKRLGKAVKKAFSVSLPSSFFGRLHHLQEQYGPVQVKLRWKDLVKEGFWPVGKYGDSGSCYWGCHSAAKDILTANGCYAVQYDLNGDKGRCWYYDSHEGSIIFNHYGPLSLQTIAKLIGNARQQDVRKINLENNGAANETFWINNGSGYLIGSDLQCYSYDFGFQDDSIRCEMCNCTVDEYETYYADDHTLCDCCFSDNYTHCCRCGEACSNDDIIEAEGEYYCEYCVDRHHTQCACCDGWRNTDNGRDNLEGEFICEDCTPAGAEICEECDCLCCDSEGHLQHIEFDGEFFCHECKDCEIVDETSKPETFYSDYPENPLTLNDVAFRTDKIQNMNPPESWSLSTCSIIPDDAADSEEGTPFQVQCWQSVNGLWAIHLDYNSSRPMFKLVHIPSNMLITSKLQTTGSGCCAMVAILEYYCSVEQWQTITDSHELTSDANYAGRHLRLANYR